MRRIAPAPAPIRQRGVAALVITVLLFFTMLMASVYLNRNLVFEQRSSANQYRATQAFEAAEAGLEWAAAQLNSPQRIGADCQATVVPETTFRERFVALDRSTSRYAGRSFGGAAATPLQAACVRAGAAWSCACPSTGAPALAASMADNAPAFILQFLGGDRPGVLRVVSTGCSSLAGVCAGNADDARIRPDAVAKVEVSFGLLGAVAALPVAALTARGAVDAGTGSLGLHNADPASGIAVHAGATVAAPLARFTAPAGASLAGAVVEGDAELAALPTARLFTSLFGIDKLGWKNLPLVRRVACTGDCTGALAAAFEAGGAHAMIWAASSDGAPVRITGPATLGTLERPVVIVVDAALQISGDVRVHGLLYAASLAWTDVPAPGAGVRGAVVVEGGYAGDAAADLVYDPPLLATLKSRAGTLVRINGSWRDY